MRVPQRGREHFDQRDCRGHNRNPPIKKSHFADARRRLTQLTNAFSKKLENFKAAVALHYAYYNFVKSNIAIRCTPAMAAGVADTFWTVRDLVEMVEG